ncbi:C1 family peptidase [Urechidicola croceus]|nr:C1 family peptidase [Urechidicola croceus]
MKKTILLIYLLTFSSLLYSQTTPRTGLLFDDDAYSATPLKARNVSFQSVVAEQSSASLKEFVPEILTQGSYGTCVGWSSAYYGRTILNARINNLTSQDDISMNAFSPVFTYLNSNVDDDYNCQGGAYINKALEAMVDKGVPYFKDYNVMCDSYIPSELWLMAEDNKIKDFNRLFDGDESEEVKIESVKRSLINGNPVIIGFQVENSFYTAKNVYEPDYGGITGGHAMCVVGYDDDKYGGAFEIVNSWGKNWGNDGFIWVRYEEFIEYTKYAFEMIPAKSIKIPENILAGELTMKLYDGSIMQIKKGTGEYKKSILGWQDVVVDESSQSIGDYITTEIHPENTRYKIYAKVNKPAYIYVVGADSDQRNGVLFPHKEGISPYISYEDTEVIVPGEKYWFRLNSDVASDYTVVIFSEDKIDINEVKTELDDLEGGLIDKLYVIFKDKLIDKNKVNLDESKMAFEAKYTKGTMALMVLDIKRK